MTVQQWPEELRSVIERQGWSLQPQDARRRRQSEVGVPSWRRRISRAPRFVTLSLLGNRDQRERFWQFYHDDCAEGSWLFSMPDPSTDGWPILDAAGVPVLTGAGEPLLLARTWLCSWGDTPPVEAMAEQVKFRIQFSVAVLS